MPFIKFDINGICNYCNNYKKEISQNLEDLYNLIDPYRKNGESKLMYHSVEEEIVVLVYI